MFTAGHFLVPPSESACCCGNKDSPVVYLPAHSPLITPRFLEACLPTCNPPMQSSSTLVNKASETLNHSPSQIAIFSQPLLITWFPGTLMENAPVPQPKNRTPKCEAAEEMQNLTVCRQICLPQTLIPHSCARPAAGLQPKLQQMLFSSTIFKAVRCYLENRFIYAN